MVTRLVVPSLAFALLASCSAPPVASSASQARVSEVAVEESPPSAARQEDVRSAQQAPKSGHDQAKDTAKKREAKAKELRSKRRELDFLELEDKVAAIDRKVRERAVKVVLMKADEDLKTIRADLEHFLTREKPRELEQWEIRIDQSTHRAEHAKDELDELVAMYEADEFAKATKELVIKRGRRSLEMAERNLGITKKEFAEFREHTLPKRLRTLELKVSDAQLALQNATLELEKSELEAELKQLRFGAKVEDLEGEIRELEKELAEAPR